jgi:tRNA(fMet)-specific endonuclease VapC
VTRFLLDTNMMGHFMNRRKGVDDRARQERAKGAVIGTCLPVVGELFFGVENSATRDKNRKLLIRALSAILCWPFERKAAEEYGRIATELKRTGRMIQQIDIQIAAVALTLGACTVVTADKGLSSVRGLRTENWAS